MEKRIELEKRNRPIDQIDELNLDNCRSTTIEGLDEFHNLKSLSLNGVGLTSLKGFPTLHSLRKLEMSDNRIAGGLQVLKDCARLVLLNLSNNKIKDLETIEPLKDLPCLKSLDLYRNEITSIDNYRRHIFQLLPGLTYLDGTDVNNKEADESDVDGLEEEDGDGPPVNGKSDLDGEDSSVKNDHDADSSPDVDDGGILELHDEDDTNGTGANDGDSNYGDAVSVVSLEPEEEVNDYDGDEEEGVQILAQYGDDIRGGIYIDDDDEVEEDDGQEDGQEEDGQEEEADEEDDGDEEEDVEEEEEEEEEESVNAKSALTEIYREDLSDCSEDGDYEEESEGAYLSGEEEEEDLETSNVIDEGEAEVPGEMDLAPLQENDDVIVIVDLEGEESGRRGVKRPREDFEDGD